MKEDYIVLPLDFQKIGTEDFADAAVFVRAFGRAVIRAFDMIEISGKKEFLQPLTELMERAEDRSLAELFFV